jgi:hypothetical protein
LHRRAKALPQFVEAPSGLKREALPCTEQGIYPDAMKLIKEMPS